MTMTVDQSFIPAPAIGVAHTLNGARLMARIAARLGAMTSGMVAGFVWLAPGAGWEADIMLFKLMVSVFAVLIALWLWDLSAEPVPPKVEIDVAAGELRVIRDGAAPEDRVLERCRFEELHLVELWGRRITFWAPGNRLLAEITLSSHATHAALVASLRGMGKLI